jgi:Na+/melibiose symporter-like transporter
MIPGIRDDQETVDNYLANVETQEREPFFKSLKSVVTHKNYLAFLILYILYQAMIQLMQASVFYHTRFVLKEQEEVVTLLILTLFLGSLISVPFWKKYTQKTQDNRKTWLLSATFMVIFAAPLTFMSSLTADLIILFLWGLAFGGFWIMITPTYGDVIDESVVNTERRKESTYGGLRQFFVNLARVIQALTLAFVHELTGFVEGASEQTPLALFGIQLHFGLIPAIYLAIGVLIFWKFYDLTPSKVQENKEKLIEKKL